jgi:predicted phosphodiesterase
MPSSGQCRIVTRMLCAETSRSFINLGRRCKASWAFSYPLANILYAENGEIFSTWNASYCAIRTQRGTIGKRARNQKSAVGATELFRPIFTIPDEQPDAEWEPYETEGSKFLTISDTHFPYHDKSSIEIAVQDGKRLGVDAVLINGDLLDSYQLSRFAKAPNKPNYAEEIKIGKQFMGYMRQEFPKAQLYWKFGNHDLHLERFLWQKAPELFGCPGMDLESFCDVQSVGVKVVKDNRRVMIGRLTALHGHEMTGGSTGPVNPARGAFLKLYESAIISHFHKTSQHTETSLSDKLISCWSMGCLCKLHPEYARLNKWNSGYATVEIDKDGAFEVTNRRIYKGRSW